MAMKQAFSLVEFGILGGGFYVPRGGAPKQCSGGPKAPLPLSAWWFSASITQDLKRVLRASRFPPGDAQGTL